MTNTLIYAVDDELDILNLLKIHLETKMFSTKLFENSDTFMCALKKKTPDLIILDLMLPISNGFDICKKLKAHTQYKNIPIILLSAKDSEDDKILGLNLGADDYVTKPFSATELIARIGSVLRRSGNNIKAKNANDPKIKKYKDILVLNEHTFEISVKDKILPFTTAEFKILSKLLEKPNWVYKRNELIAYIWKDNRIVSERTIDVHIRHIRSKLEQALQQPITFIKNVRGIGYKIEE